MPSERDKASEKQLQHWQFGMKEYFLQTVLVVMPIVLFRMAFSLHPGYIALTLAVIAVGMAGGVVVGLAFWALTGMRRGFVIGYCFAGFWFAIAALSFLTMPGSGSYFLPR